MKKRIASHIVFMVTLGSCNYFCAMDTKQTPIFTINRVIEIEPDDYVLDPRKPTIKDISFITTEQNLHLYQAIQQRRNTEFVIQLQSAVKLNVQDWQKNRSPLFLDVYNQSTSEQMFFKYISSSVESVSNQTIPPIYTRIERSSNGTVTFIKTYPVATEEQSKPPKTTRPYVAVDTPEDSDSILGKESDDDFLDQLAAQQKSQKKNTPLVTIEQVPETDNPKATRSFFTPLIVSGAGLIAFMIMLYKSDRLPERFTQFFNTLLARFC